MSIDRVGEAETLQAIADSGSFSDAAKQLGISQSTVSRRISTLEKRLGNETLVWRTTREVHLTDAGRIYLNQAKSALEQLYLIEQQILEQAAIIQGTVRLSLPPAIGRIRLLPAVEQLLIDHPKLRVELDFSERYVDFFQDEIDLAIRIRKTSQVGIEAEQIGQTEVLLVASAAYMGEMDLSSPANLARVRLIAPKSQYATEFDRLMSKLDLPQDQIQVHIDDLEAVRRLVMSGYGAGFLPKTLVHDELAHGRLVEIDAGQKKPILKFYATYSHQLRHSKRLQLVLSRLRDVISPNGNSK